MKTINKKLLTLVGLAVFSVSVFAANSNEAADNRWVDVSLKNTSEFDITCQYRWYYEPDFAMNYATSSTPITLSGTLWYPHPSDHEGVLVNWHLFTDDKTTVYLTGSITETIRIDKMEKLCF